MEKKIKQAIAASLIYSFILSAVALVPHGETDVKNYMSVEVPPLLCKNREVTLKVTRSDGSPLKEVNVDIYFQQKKAAYGKTDVKGLFIFTPKDGGSYRAEFQKSGYADSTIALNVSRQCGAPETTTTIRTTTLTIETTSSTVVETTSTTLETTPTTKPICNLNRICESDAGENYNTCPSDCAGKKDGVCDKRYDGTCDPDCGRTADTDCLCNGDGKCDKYYEDYIRCPGDCPSGSNDGICDQAADGKCDPDCNESTDSECKKTDYSGILPMAIGVLVVFGIVAYLNMRREMKKMDDEKSRDALLEELIERLKEGEDPEALRKELMAEGKDPEVLEKAEQRIWQ